MTTFVRLSVAIVLLALAAAEADSSDDRLSFFTRPRAFRTFRLSLEPFYIPPELPRRVAATDAWGRPNHTQQSPKTVAGGVELGGNRVGRAAEQLHVDDRKDGGEEEEGEEEPLQLQASMGQYYSPSLLSRLVGAHIHARLAGRLAP